MDSKLERLKQNRSKIYNTLTQNQEPLKVGSLNLYPCRYREDEMFVCFSQPEKEDILELTKFSEEIIFL